MLNLKYIKITTLLISLGMSFKPITVSGFQMSEPELRKTIYEYLSIYAYGAIDEKAVDDFVELTQRHSEIFDYLAEAETDSEFLPYVEKYSDLKVRFTGRPINTNIKVIFSSNPLTTNYSETIDLGVICDPFTRIIFIDRDLWNYYRDNEKLREALLFHEAGHCDLRRDHSWDERNENFSFMSSRIIEFLLFPNPPTIADFENSEHFSEAYASYETQRNIIINARSNLDNTFEKMYQELFSAENTVRNLICEGITIAGKRILPDECIITPRKILQQTERSIPTYKHMTIGPSL